ncbi:sugar ABC transporter substrate-binding protein [Amycolatopsis thermophila]|uniref:Ribose transport system substrate-binding protein n=1 Tax=Amycolatopsis thermophila TaxID=206084 RepID=A0ABU0F188_9PSEU|nr:sugar ABC transporter substrate-binding protein [Amycolatopsis thermophila]MDQ0381281.1 ribose transport system substrate-binding protein [Amycolatopsis thermophila]
MSLPAGLHSRRALLKSAMSIGVAATMAPLLAACNNAGVQASAPLPTPTITNANDPRNKRFRMIDSFYTLDNDYFQGWAKGSAAAASMFLLSRDQEVDNSNVDTLKSVFESAPTKGIQGISTLPNTAAATPDIIGGAERAGIYVSSNWSNAPWSTPLDIGDHYFSYQAANDVAGAREVCKVLFQAMGGTGKFIHIEGNKGNSASDNRTAGVDQALAAFPGIKMVARQSGGFSRGATQPVIENLLTANPDVTGIMCQNDDSAIAAINAVEARGMSGVKIVGIDAIGEFLDAMKRGSALATWAHHGAWIGAYSTVRVFDALAGYRPTLPERMVYFGGFIIDTADAAQEYQDLMYSSKPLPFDYELMSRALHPDDWDPQNSLVPIDPAQYWPRDPKPAGYELPAPYRQPQFAADLRTATDRFRAAFRKDPFASVRRKCRNGGQDVLA